MTKKKKVIDVPNPVEEVRSKIEAPSKSLAKKIMDKLSTKKSNNQSGEADIVGDKTPEVDPEQEMCNKVIQLCQKYIIADQSELILHALNKGLYKFSDMEYYGRNLRERANKFYLVYNDLASHLLEEKEKVLINKDGSWWFTLVDDKNPITKSKVLRKIIAKSENTPVAISPV